MYRKNYSFILNIIPVKTTWNVGGMKGGGGGLGGIIKNCKQF